MIEETVEMETPEEDFDSEEGLVPVEEDGSILPVLGIFGAVGGVTAVIVAAAKCDLPGRIKSSFKAAGKAFKEYESPKKEESTEPETETYVEVESVEDSAE